MTTRADVNKLLAANRRLVAMAERDLIGLFATLDLSRPELVRDALLEITPILVREYGDLAAAVTAEWYEEVRAASVGRSGFAAETVAAASVEKIEGSVRWAAQGLFGDDPESTLSALSGAMQRHISYSSRETVRRNVFMDPKRPMFARVPTGAKTCAFCSMLASRGFVYHSEATAGDESNEYHDDCNCQVVPEWDKDQAHIEGYDPDLMYAQYMSARAGLGDYPETKDVLANMRRMYPDSFTDGAIPRD